MSFWRTKSEQNEAAAAILSEKKLFASTIHCYYYRCLQLMVHQLIIKKHFTEKEYEEKTTEGQGSHNFLINEMYKALLIKNKGKAIEFNSTIAGLKLRRTKADYKNVEITQQMSETSERDSIKICGIVSTTI